LTGALDTVLQRHAFIYGEISQSTTSRNNDNNDNDKRLGLTAQADPNPITKKYSTLKIKIDNKAVQKLHTS